jgi:hypothetical protein
MDTPAADRVMETLRAVPRHRTVDALARDARVCRSTAEIVLRGLDAEGRLDICRDGWPNSYLLTGEPALAAGDRTSR